MIHIPTKLKLIASIESLEELEGYRREMQRRELFSAEVRALEEREKRLRKGRAKNVRRN